MAKKKEIAELTQEWHNSVKDDTPNEHFVPKSKKADIEDDNTPIYEDPPKMNGVESHSTPVHSWTDDWTQLKEVTKINKELRGFGNNKRWVNMYYGELK